MDFKLDLINIAIGITIAILLLVLFLLIDAVMGLIQLEEQFKNLKQI
ncbi:hypothetical protein SAMN05444278_1143 [Psychroflexus salarius]|uniref:Uncharacterized protein n=1 Tax=Psychroflexus salarius TaxID=1155689 RepID=A0A1M4Y5B6_9FLAO|nr:hypothetical protein SAMN05444278_1143 [Psychroflexus salarius]